MESRAGIESVIQFYETHPINEQQILRKLEEDGIALEGLTDDVLQAYDQDHFGRARRRRLRSAPEAAGCTVIEREDLGELWTVILKHRHEMYRSMRSTTVERFGESHSAAGTTPTTSSSGCWAPGSSPAAA